MAAGKKVQLTLDWKAPGTSRETTLKNSFATKPPSHEGMICMLNHQINYG